MNRVTSFVSALATWSLSYAVALPQMPGMDCGEPWLETGSSDLLQPVEGQHA
jgi:hypothetical protein